MITTQKELRSIFWASHTYQRRPGWKQNQYPTDTRIAWCDFVEYMSRSGQISYSLARRASL